MSSSTNSTRRAVLYHRVSTVDQDQAGARTELRQAAAARGLDVVLEVEETGSGARNDRPGLRQVLEMVRRHKADVVLVWKLDRFGRSVLDVLANIQELTRAGARFVAVTQGIDVSPDGDAVSRLVLTLLAAVAEFERDLIRERTRLGLSNARKKGVTLGRPPTHPAPDHSRVAALLAAGRSRRSIARELGVGEWAIRRMAGAAAKGK